MAIRIIADSTCDLTDELVKEYGINILPLHIIMGEKSFSDGVDITPEDIFAWSDANELTPTTSAPSLQEAINCFKSVRTSSEDEIISFSISSSMSSSNSVMHLAASELEIEDKVFVVDSANLCCGIGILILEAAKMAQKGLNAAEIYDRINEMKGRINTSFVVNNLTYLYRGGRCGGLAMMVGSTLRLHPKIVVEGGAMHSTKKYRGKMRKAISDYVNDLDRELALADKETLFIVHAVCDEDIIEAIRKETEKYSFNNVYVAQAGGVISSHCGSGCFGLIFMNGN